MIHAVVSFPVRVAAFSITLAWIAGAPEAMTQWMWMRFIPGPPSDIWDLLGVDPALHWLFQFATGLVLLLTFPAVAKGLALLQRSRGSFGWPWTLNPRNGGCSPATLKPVS
ncbi:hypothetical protein [Arthrobacter sp. Soil782]|uniref:hypothetical protein n=1 Tax=Arthrobacter sp. Soil782 TaxID=1736410 RepID=UPI003FA4C287